MWTSNLFTGMNEKEFVLELIKFSSKYINLSIRYTFNVKKIPHFKQNEKISLTPL